VSDGCTLRAVIGFVSFKRSGKAAAGAVEPNRQRVGSKAEHLCGLPQLEPFPSHQQEQLAVALAQAGERRSQARGFSPTRMGGRRHHDRLGREPIVQTHPSTLAASVIGQDMPSDAQQPRQRFLRQIGPASPSDQEHVGDHIVSRLRIAATHRVAAHRTGMKRVQRLEIPFDPHHQKCPSAPDDYTLGTSIRQPGVEMPPHEDTYPRGVPEPFLGMTDLLSSPDRASTDPTAAARALAALLGSIHRDARREARSLPRPEEYAAAARGFWDAMRACADAEAGRDERELAGVRARVREQLNPWFLRSRYWNRAYVKPHGYAGDFRMLEWIYDLERAECADPTQPAVVNVLDRLFADLHSARSVWRRRAWFARLVRDRVERSSRPVRVLDIACGGSRYLRDVIDGRLDVTFVDQDSGALAFVDQVHAQPNGGFAWVLDWHDGECRVTDATNHCYGLAFVLLAHAHALMAGVADAAEGLERCWQLMEQRFWRPENSLYADEAAPDWTVGPYRGQNANMHACEAMQAAWRATKDRKYLDRAVALAEAVTGRLGAKSAGLPGVIPDCAALVWEHFREDWSIDPDYNRGDRTNIFRPWGFQTGHQTEWTKLLLQLDRLCADAGLAPAPERLARARAFFDAAMRFGWDDAHGGLAYGFAPDGALYDGDKYHWVQAESLAAAAWLAVALQQSGAPAADVAHYWR